MGKRKENTPPATLERELLRLDSYLNATAWVRVMRNKVRTEERFFLGRREGDHEARLTRFEALHGIRDLAERKRRLKALLLKLSVRGVDLAGVSQCLLEARVGACADAFAARGAKAMRAEAQRMHEVLDPVRQRLHAVHREDSDERRRGEEALRALKGLLAIEGVPEAPAHRPPLPWLQEARRRLKTLGVPRAAAEELLQLGGLVL